MYLFAVLRGRYRFGQSHTYITTARFDSRMNHDMVNNVAKATLLEFVSLLRRRCFRLRSTKNRARNSPIATRPAPTLTLRPEEVTVGDGPIWLSLVPSEEAVRG